MLYPQAVLEQVVRQRTARHVPDPSGERKERKHDRRERGIVSADLGDERRPHRREAEAEEAKEEAEDDQDRQRGRETPEEQAGEGRAQAGEGDDDADGPSVAQMSKDEEANDGGGAVVDNGVLAWNYQVRAGTRPTSSSRREGSR